MPYKKQQGTSWNIGKRLELSKRGRTSIARAVLKTHINKNQIDSINKQERNKTNE